MDWISVTQGLPLEGRYIVHSSYGVHCAYRHDPKWADCFQDERTQNDEGMRDDMGKIFIVYHYMPLPQPPKE